LSRYYFEDCLDGPVAIVRKALTINNRNNQ